MGAAPDNHALSERIAVLEERMNTMRADYRVMHNPTRSLKIPIDP